MNDSISLQQIDNITITVTDKQGNVAVLPVTGDELIARIKDFRYQTLCHALTSGVSDLMATFSIEAYKEQPAIQHIQKCKVRQDVSYSPRQSWRQGWYFEIDKKDYAFETEQEAKLILEHVNHINSKLKIK